MKIRSGFISNSSSSSFIIPLAALSGKQIGELATRFTHHINKKYFICLETISTDVPQERKRVEDVVDSTLIKWTNTTEEYL